MQNAVPSLVSLRIPAHSQKGALVKEKGMTCTTDSNAAVLTGWVGLDPWFDTLCHGQERGFSTTSSSSLSRMTR